MQESFIVAALAHRRTSLLSLCALLLSYKLCSLFNVGQLVLGTRLEAPSVVALTAECLFSAAQTLRKARGP